MAMLFARAAVPAWVIILGLGAFLAPAGIATTVLLVALCLVCIPAVITAGVWKRSLNEPTADVMDVWHRARRPPKAIEAEFVAEDAAPGDIATRRRSS
jgi:hypothetical protein